MDRSQVDLAVIEYLSCDGETGVIRWKKNTRTRARAGDVAGSIQSTGYRQIKIKGVSILAHHIVWRLERGAWPTIDVDHINGDRDDNRIANLREATRSQNLMNQARVAQFSESGRRGVSRKGKGWVAEINVGGSRLYLGYTQDLGDAVALREAAEKKYYGDFAPAR